MADLVFIPRSEWGASAATEAFIRNRYSASPREKTSIQVHHTAGTSSDATPNRWNLAEAVAYMRRLEWVRPDLGPLPYSVNLAVSEDLETVWVFQARGILKVGAHTGGHNRDGVGFGVFGNFDKPDTQAAQVLVDAIEHVCHDLRYGGVWSDRLIEGGAYLPYLGDARNPKGWLAWGHRDSSTKTCPGHSLYPLLAGFDHLEQSGPPVVDPEDMRVQEFVEGLTPENIDQLIDAEIIKPKTQAARDYWKAMLASPSDPAWKRFVTEVEVQSVLRAGGPAPANFTFTGTAKAA